jgi:hypothetical protein
MTDNISIIAALGIEVARALADAGYLSISEYLLIVEAADAPHH